MHESSRVYGDKMIEEKDMDMLKKLQLQTAKDSFEVCDGVWQHLCIPFVFGVGEGPYTIY